jgi:aspartyl aminopeptidase
VATTPHLQSLADFITASPSSFHAVAEAARQLAAAGFVQLSESETWDAGTGSFFVIRDGAIVAWRQSEGAIATTPYRIVGSHTDSPGFKLKPQPSPVDLPFAMGRRLRFAPARCFGFRSSPFTSIAVSTPMASSSIRNGT